MLPVRAAAFAAVTAAAVLLMHGPARGQETPPAPLPAPADGAPRILADPAIPDDGVPDVIPPPAPSSGIAGNLGAMAGPQSAAGTMIGDLLASGGQSATLRVPLVKGAGSFALFQSGPNASVFITGDGQDTLIFPGPYTAGGDASGDGNADTWSLAQGVAGPDSTLRLYGSGATFVLDPATSSAVLNGGTPGNPAINGDVADLAFSSGRLSFDATALIDVAVPLPSPSMSVRTLRLAENNGVMPQDRILFNYAYYNNARLGPGESIDVNQYTFGVERTFWHGILSLEIRAPFASTLDSNQVTGSTDLTATEFGNLGLVAKCLVYSRQNLMLGAGFALGLPTADDSRLLLADGTEILRIENEAVHMLPYVGALVNRDRFFVQGFAQLDFGLNQNSVLGDVTGQGSLRQIGRQYDQRQLFLDLEVGYWLCRRQHRCGRISGVVPALELHYTTSLDDIDLIDADGIAVGSDLNRFDHLNLTAGTHFLFASGAEIAPGFAIPLRTGDDRQFDYEFQVQTNWRF